MLTILSVLLVLTSVRFVFFSPREAEAAWFDDDYAYRQPFSFTHNADISTERRITFSLDTAELITAGVMQSDCDDTRFTNINGLVLRYELTGTCNNAATTYEVVFPSIINGTNPAYVYYGNPSAESASEPSPVTVAVTRTAANTSTGTQDFTTTDLGGQTPKAAIFITSYAVTDGTPIVDAALSVGAATGTTNRWVLHGNSEDAQGTTDTDRETRTAEVIHINNPGTSTDLMVADFDSFITNGVKVDWTLTSTAVLVTVILFAGPDLSAHADSIADISTTLDATTDITAPGFEPDIVFSGSMGVNGDQNENLQNNSLSFGVTHNDGAGGITQRSWSHSSRNAQIEATVEFAYSELYGVVYPADNALRYALDLNTFDSSGFSVTTKIDNSNAESYWYLALKFGGEIRSAVGTHDTPTSAGDDSETGPGFIPQMVLLGMTHMEVVDITVATSLSGTSGISAFDEDEAYATSQQDADAADPTDTQSLSDNVAVEIPDDDGTTGVTAAFVSFDANGWTNNYSAVKAAAKKFWFLAIEDPLRIIPLTPSGGDPSITDRTNEEKGPGPAAYWKFDEGYGETFNDATSNSNDLTNSNIDSIEQQINILDQQWSTTSQTAVPTDNSLGLVRWDGTKYSGETVYFEAIIRGSGGFGSPNFYASLHDSSGTQVVEVSLFAQTSFTRVRSNSITLTDDTDYTVRARRTGGNADADTVFIKAARIIVVQSDSDGISDTETQIEIGNVERQSSSTATQITDSPIYRYDSTQFSPTPTAYFEATIRSTDPTIEQQINIIDQEFTTTSTTYVPTDNSLGLVHWDGTKYSDETVYFEAVFRGSSGGGSPTFFAALFDSGGTEVSGSEVSAFAQTSYLRVRSGAITLTDGTDYTVRIHRNNDTDTLIKAARLIVVQTNTTNITDTRTQVEVGNNQTGFTNTTYSALTDEKIYRYDQDQFAATPEASGDVEFHATLKIDDSADTVYAQLWNNTNSTQVAEITHTGDTNWTLIDATFVPPP